MTPGITTCPECGNEVPEGEFCGACGAHLPTGAVRRAGAYAADPGQHVLQPDVVSTLFPHLPHRQSAPFRLGLIAIALALTALGLLRLTGPGIALAAAGIPVLYLLYLWEVDVYRDEPIPVIGLTLGLGLLLGIPWGILTGPIVTRAVIHATAAGASPRDVLVTGILLPLVAQAFMLLGPLILYVRGHYRQPLDGFAFGAACALGFTFTSTLVNLAPELRQGLTGGGPAITNTIVILGRGLLIPFLSASTTALVAGSLWLARRPTRRVPLTPVTSIASTVVAAVIVRVVLGLVQLEVHRPAYVVTIYLVLAALLLIWVRVALHTLLLREAADVRRGPIVTCPNCRRQVACMAFCSQCGIAMQATPRTAWGRGGEDDVWDRPGGERYRARRWGGAAGVLIVGAIALGVIGLIVSPSRGSACGALCAPPPPPCLGVCTQASSAPPMKTRSTYTSSEYGYSVDYTEFHPSRQDNSSVEWDLSSDSGQYAIQVLAAPPRGRNARQIVNSIIDNNFSDYNLVYEITGAEVGYTPGAGGVWDDEVAPFFGSASDTRLVVLVAEKKNLAIAVVATGDAGDTQSDHPNPSGLPVASFVDSITNGSRWPGDPRR